MPRQPSVATRARIAVSQIEEVYEQVSQDGRIDPDEAVQMIDALEEASYQVRVVEQTHRVIACVIETGPESRKFKDKVRAFTLLPGGLSEQFGPGAA